MKSWGVRRARWAAMSSEWPLGGRFGFPCALACVQRQRGMMEIRSRRATTNIQQLDPDARFAAKRKGERAGSAKRPANITRISPAANKVAERRCLSRCWSGRNSSPRPTADLKISSHRNAIRWPLKSLGKPRVRRCAVLCLAVHATCYEGTEVLALAT
jgi:hypothetical protein